MSAHTPGPWSLWKDVCHGPHGMITDDAHARHIARIEGGAPEVEANARLIAAAPDLLAACEVGLSYLEAVCFNTPNPKKRNNYADAARILRAAIAKATGEPA